MLRTKCPFVKDVVEGIKVLSGNERTAPAPHFLQTNVCLCSPEISSHFLDLVLYLQDKRTFKEFLGADTVGIWKTCAELESKPRAFMCVVGDEEMKKCEDMINKFQTVTCESVVLSVPCLFGYWSEELNHNLIINTSQVSNTSQKGRS